MKKLVPLAAFAVAFGLAGSVAAQSFAKPEDAIKYRKATMTVMGAHLGALGAMASGRAPYDAAAAARHGDVLVVAATLPWAGFVAGSDKGDTRAKSEIWTEAAKFKESHDRLNGDMVKLAAAAKTGSLDQLKAAMGPNTGTCKTCHDAYRKD